ncbi:Hypothetical protein R9X50_00103800 [Acrodontium crateriforme]|uniref:BTB domain-containing protein n=1 Tax=Acrodontium crateriforme TaxID=150365 RepID=A0AAQ3R2I1_9PEZI|nr:Hypothetical protein R9X50_00103800 [Acrodontium crateriforme]
MSSDDSSPTSSWSFLGLTSASSSDTEKKPAMAAAAPESDLNQRTSIFGSALPSSSSSSSPSTAPPPLLALTQPSEDNLSVSQPPLSTLSASPSRSKYTDDGVRSTASRRRMPSAQKDTDDPTHSPDATRTKKSSTLATLSRLFAVQAPTSPDHSRQSSYEDRPCRAINGYTRNLNTGDMTALPDHLYNRGLMEGRHSDITVNAFGHKYKLHRLILDRAPFFTSALSEPWLEASASEITIHPEDVDGSITQASFELALKRLYGCCNPNEEDGSAVGLFATGCWLEMNDLVDSSMESMLRQMTVETIGPLIKLVTNNYYGRAGDKILASAKAMLCRDGWKMPLRHWDTIPGEIIREIVGGDGFFIAGEWDRWILAKRILNRRLKSLAIEAGLVQPGRRRKVLQAPASANLMAMRFDGVYRRNSMGAAKGVPQPLGPWITLYTHPDVEPVLVLMDEGVHYMHLDFEHLQLIRRTRDCLGLPVLPDTVVSNALWQQMELRQRVTNARESEMELGLSVKCKDEAGETGLRRNTTMAMSVPSAPGDTKGKQRDSGLDFDEDVTELHSGSWDGNGMPRKFWIPSSDCNIVMGGSADPVIATSHNTSAQRHAARLSSTLQPEDVQWAADFASITAQPRPWPPTGHDGAANEVPNEVRYTHFPPFRFAAEFPNPRVLGKKRVYSRTIFYAGSLWNIYVQKVVSTRSRQLGVYLHRAKEQETEKVLSGSGRFSQGSVDERIGQLEREMLMRGDMTRPNRNSIDAEDGETSASNGDQGPETFMNRLEARGSSSRKSAGRADGLAFPARGNNFFVPSDDDSDASNESSDDEDADAYVNNNRQGQKSEALRSMLREPTTTNFQELAPALPHPSRTSTIPPYVDARPTIKTYFKIYSPSRGGRMLSVYESAPDEFTFAQSWGWKSSTLMLDEGLWSGGDEEDNDLGSREATSVDHGENIDGRTSREGGRAGNGDGKLRFMVVIGNI